MGKFSINPHSHKHDYYDLIIKKMNIDIIKNFLDLNIKQEEYLKYATNINIAITEFLKGLIDSEVKTESHFTNKIEINGVCEMKYICKRKDNRYIGRKQINNKQILVYGKTQKDCLNKLKKAIKNINNNQPTIKNITLKEWLEKWSELYKKPFLSEKSYKNLLIYINHINTEIGKYHLNELNEINIQKYLNNLKKSRNKELITLYLKASLKKAYSQDLIKKDIFNNVVIEEKQNNIREPFNYNEQKLILENSNSLDIFPIILFYLVTGIRKNELTKELLNNIDYENKLLKIKCEKKRNKEIYRYIDLTQETIELIKNNKDLFLIPTETIYKKFNKYLKTLNIKGSLHTLRHTFATNHFYLGTPDIVISNWLGHTKVELTKNIYTKIDRTTTKQKILNLYKNYYFLYKK